jgi:translational activator of cytochrome c oxidase 1
MDLLYSEDLFVVDSRLKFTCPPNSLATLTSAVAASGLSREVLASELVYTPSSESALPDETIETQIADLVEDLEEQEDTLRVWTTLDT